MAVDIRINKKPPLWLTTTIPSPYYRRLYNYYVLYIIRINEIYSRATVYIHVWCILADNGTVFYFFINSVVSATRDDNNRRSHHWRTVLVVITAAVFIDKITPSYHSCITSVVCLLRLSSPELVKVSGRLSRSE